MERGSVLKNLGYLSISRALTLIMGLITTSHLARVLQAENLGILGFSAAVAAYLVLIVNLGFDVYVVREVAVRRIAVRELTDSVVTIRLLFSMVTFLALVLSLPHFRKNHIEQAIIFIQGLSVFSAAISLNSLYSGLQRMDVVASRELTANSLNMLGVLLLVRHQGDVVIAALLTVGTAMLSNLMLMSRYFTEFGLPRLDFNVQRLWSTACKSIPFFWAGIGTAVTYNFHFVVLGITRSVAEVGLFSAAWKIFLLTTVAPSVISSVFLPRITSLLDRPAERQEVGLIYMQAIILCGLPMTLIGSMLIPLVIHVLFGPGYDRATGTLAILLINSFVVALNFGLAIPMVSVGRQIALMRVALAGAVASAFFDVVLIPPFGIEGAGAATLIAETVILGFLMWDRPEVSLTMSAVFIARCMAALIPAALTARLVAATEPLGHSDLITFGLASAVSPIIYFVMLRIMHINISSYVDRLNRMR